MAKRSLPLSFTFISKTIAIAIVTYVGLYRASTLQHGDHFNNKDTYISFAPYRASDQSDTSVFDKTIEDMVTRIDNDLHPTADLTAQESFKSICGQYKSICNKTTFTSSEFSDRQKLYYQVLIIYAIRKISDIGIPVNDYVDNITVRSSSSKSRGYSSRNQIVLDTKIMNGYSEFLRVLVHELGHIVDFRNLEGQNSYLKNNVYTEFGKKVFAIDDPSIDFYSISWINENTRSRSATYKDFVSGYSMSDIFEDFAETINFYLNYKSIFQELTKQSDALLAKYNFIDSIFGGQYLNNGEKKKSQFEQYKRDFRPYDTTRF
ncbi:MAG: hypothetical protein WC004_03180 [Candidatus Absconditabacterales bacterium]